MAKSSNEQIEQDEKKLLFELMKNSKENIDTIAKHCGFSRQKAWRMIKQLENNQKIWGYSAIIDVEKQGLQKFILFFKHSVDMIAKVGKNEFSLNGSKEDLLSLDIQIESSYNIHDKYDWVMIFTAKDLMHAKRFVDFITTRYPGLIKEIYLTQVLYTLRDHFIINPNPLTAKEFVSKR